MSQGGYYGFSAPASSYPPNYYPGPNVGSTVSYPYSAVAATTQYAAFSNQSMAAPPGFGSMANSQKPAYPDYGFQAPSSMNTDSFNSAGSGFTGGFSAPTFPATSSIPRLPGSYSGVNPASGTSAMVSGPFPSNSNATSSESSRDTAPASGGNTTYTGYDAAVYAAAKSYLQDKATKKDGVFGGGGYANKKFGRFQPSTQRLQRNFCSTCRVSCVDDAAWETHLSGKQHKKKEEAQKTGVPAVALQANKPSYKCELCQVTCTTLDAYTAHVRGARHIKAAKLLGKLGKSIPNPDEPTIIMPKKGGGVTTQTYQRAKKVIGIQRIDFIPSGGVGAKNGSSNIGSLQDHYQDLMNSAEKEPEPVGEDYIEVKQQGGGTQRNVFHCKLCDCEIIDQMALDMHLKGRRHRLQYKQKVDPSLVVELGPAGNWKARKHGTMMAAQHEQAMLQQQQMEYWGMRRMQEEMKQEAMMRMQQGLVMMPPELMISDDDRHITAKHSEIEPNEEELAAIQRIVTNTERALKAVSDGLEADRKPMETQKKSPVAPPQERLIKGLMRIGALANGVLIKGQLYPSIVLMCTNKPTSGLLVKVFQGLKEQYTKMKLDKQYELAMDIPEACVYVTTMKSAQNESESPAKMALIEIKLSVMLTSLAVETSSSLAENAPPEKDPKDMLSRTKCLRTLAVIRRTKWFQINCLPSEEVLMIIRIMKDLCSRVPTWKVLSEWALEVLVVAVHESAGMELTSAELFNRLFEMIGSGFLLPFGSGLEDPCEKEDSRTRDIFGHMKPQQREDITASSQHALRLIAFDQIHQVLGIEKLDPLVKELPDEPAIPSLIPNRKRLFDASGLKDIKGSSKLPRLI